MPDRAYLIRGHGYEDDKDGVCYVPDGCLLVVKMKAGQQALFPAWNKFFNCSEEDLNIYLNPIENIKKLEKKLSVSFEDDTSLAIYRPGQTCPNFTYYLNMLKYQGKEGELSVEGLAGIYKSPFKLDDITLLEGISVNRGNTDLENNFIKYYTGSLLPTIDDVRKIINEKNIINMDDIQRTYYKGDRGFIITQKEIFDKVTSGDFMPGVFYNLVCRSIRDVKYDPMWFMRNYSYNLKEINNPYDRRGVNKLNIRRLLSKKEGLIHPVVKKRISEAELQRKFLQKGNNLKGGYRKNHTRKKKIRKNSTRYSRRN